MGNSNARLILAIAGATLAVAALGSAQSAETNDKSLADVIIIRLTDRSAIHLLNAIEYGAPEKLSFTSAYFYDLPRLRTENYATTFRLSVAPGLAGIRLKAGLGTYSHAGPGLHADVVLMRTWGDPLKLEPDQNWVGAELRATALVSVGVGYYQRIEAHRGRDSLVSVRFGVGY